MRLVREGAVKRINHIIAVEDFFKQKEIPLVSAIKNKNNSTSVLIDGSLFVLYPFVFGSHMDISTIEEAPLRSLAQTFAKIHLVGSWT